MLKLWIVAKNEFYRYFISPLAYVYLICFLLLNGSFAFYFGHFFGRGQADLSAMFSFQPWLYLLFIPGISMRLWAEEFRTKTILQILTLPVSISALVWGKFLASWLFCALALVLTFPFWITVNILGQPDNMVIVSGYLGSLLLAGCMLAISQTMSALTKNQVIALVLAVIANLLFFLSGLEYVLGLFRAFMPLPVIDMIASFSFLTHFDTISRGLFELRDIIFFCSLIILFNYTSVLIISFKTSGTTVWLKSGRRGYYIALFVFLLAGFAGLNLLANNILRGVKIDFTQERLFTFTPSTEKILQNLPGNVTARIYYSPILGERNPEFRLFFDRLRLMLKQYAELSGGRLHVRISIPEPLSNTEDRALNAGLQPLPVIDTSTNAYFGLELSTDDGKKRTIPFFPLERRPFLEQDLSEALYLLNHRKKNLGIITSLPMFEEVIQNVATAQWEIITQLKNFYNITVFDNEHNDFGNIDALMIVHPRNLSPQTLQKIRQYGDNGGKILAFFDIAAEAPRIFSPASEELKPSDYGTLPQDWGFKFFNEAVVADLGNSSAIDATVDYKSNPEFTQDLIQFYIKDNGFNSRQPETELLKKMLATSVSVFAPLPGAKIDFIPLLEAGSNSELMSSSVVYDSVHPSDILRHFKQDENPKYLAARVISTDPARPFEVIVVGDSDLLYDSFWTAHRTIFENNYSVPILDNANFVFNALDTLLGNDELISLRGKTSRERPFHSVEALRKDALYRFKLREAEIFENMARAKRGLQEVWGKKQFEGRQTFTPDELAVIAGIRKEIDRQRQELYSIRKDAGQEIAKIENLLKFFDIYAIPLLLLILLLTLNLRGRQTAASPRFEINRRFVYIALTSVLLLAAGTFAAYENNRGSQDELLEGKPLFPKLPQQINDVTAITLQNHGETLRFVLQNGLWTLPEHPDFLVYQDRIRSFLSALLEATYYEKKTSDLQKLPLFGFLPLTDENSPTTRIELTGKNGRTILSFDVGKYNLNLGRGSEGAYVRFDNRFQVWLAAMELIDLQLNPADWTFSTLWNLRFGRLASVNGQNNTSFVADIAKELLNIYFISARPQIDKSVKVLELDIAGEGDSHTIINFYRDNGRYYAAYKFMDTAGIKSLSEFASYAKAVFYEISDSDLEKIKNAVLKSETN